jgi:hypothetical protein
MPSPRLNVRPKYQEDGGPSIDRITTLIRRLMCRLRSWRDGVLDSTLPPLDIRQGFSRSTQSSPRRRPRERGALREIAMRSRSC